MSKDSSIRGEEELERQALLPKVAGSCGLAVDEEESDELLPPSEKNYHPFLDITRILCVWCVAVDHGNSSFGIWNIMFTQDWVLQYLFLVCGVSYGLSSKSLIGYELRLLAYAVIGILFNWTAWIVTGQDWRHQFFNVVFHFWFIVGLMGYAILLAPLKPWLARVRGWPRSQGGLAGAPEENHPLAEQALRPGSFEQYPRDVLLKYLVGIGGGLLAIFLFFQVVLTPLRDLLAPEILALSKNGGTGASFWGFPQDLEGSKAFLGDICTYFTLTCSNIYIVFVCPLLIRNPSYTSWAVIINTYGHRLLFYRGKDERPFHGVDLMFIALTCYYLGLRHRRKIGEYVIRYWFLVIFVCAMLWPPGTFGRFDENPPTDIDVRIRVNLLEGIFVTVWLVAGERLVQPEIFTEDRLDFLNDWALIVFLVHKAVHIMCVPPLNWAVLVAIAPVCYVCRRRA